LEGNARARILRFPLQDSQDNTAIITTTGYDNVTIDGGDIYGVDSSLMHQHIPKRLKNGFIYTIPVSVREEGREIPKGDVAVRGRSKEKSSTVEKSDG